MRYFEQFSSPDHQGNPPALAALASALEASWDHLTAYRGVFDRENPASGQCYPTSRVVQWFYPEYEVASGNVWTGSRIERHFWNVRVGQGNTERIDLSWQQFPESSVIQRFDLIGRSSLDHSPGTRQRCVLLLERVVAHLATARRDER